MVIYLAKLLNPEVKVEFDKNYWYLPGGKFAYSSFYYITLIGFPVDHMYFIQFWLSWKRN